MKIKYHTAPIEITLTADDTVLSVDLPFGYIGDGDNQIYLSENDGLQFQEIFPAFQYLLPDDAKASSNNVNEAWIEHWNPESLAAVAGTYSVLISQCWTMDDDQDEWEYADTSAIITGKDTE